MVRNCNEGDDQELLSLAYQGKEDNYSNMSGVEIPTKLDHQFYNLSIDDGGRTGSEAPVQKDDGEPKEALPVVNF